MSQSEHPPVRFKAAPIHHCNSSILPSAWRQLPVCLFPPSFSVSRTPPPRLCLSARHRCPHPVCVSGLNTGADVRLGVSGLSRWLPVECDTKSDQTRKWQTLAAYLCLVLLCHSFCESFIYIYISIYKYLHIYIYIYHHQVKTCSYQLFLLHLPLAFLSFRIKIK